ncbi:hypothetical protein Cgig2_005889 [Carnegiea gigantea]|uniref:RNase H type-1 domain-containing protein n=1 Tax=Carnegiea gigantea TaxID=171969 RepID=A0A9Q1JPV5_9CARY|nr:hypothetical protein Cgig2_005889 [Carnegiea gigantea]
MFQSFLPRNCIKTPKVRRFNHFFPEIASRNELYFQQKRTPWELIRGRAIRCMQEFNDVWEHTRKKRASMSQVGPNVWASRSNNCVKINVDAALLDGNWVGLDTVIRDVDGLVVTGGVKRVVKAYWVPEVIEGKAALYGLGLARRFGFQWVILDFDY